MDAASPPPTIAELLAAARARLAEPREAEILAAHALATSRETLYAHPERPVSAAEAENLLALVARRAAGEPVAYLIGTREFYGLRLSVNSSVLIPRPETELLVDLALKHLDQLNSSPLPHWGERARVRGANGTASRPSPSSQPSPHRGSRGKNQSPPEDDRDLFPGTSNEPAVADAGTGSGAIALAIAHERPDAEIIAADRSAAALAVAAANARKLSIPNVTFVRADWLAPFAAGSLDLIVSNPPYVAASDPHLAQGDLRFEPPAALSAGPDGLAVIRRLIADAATRLKSGGRLVLEHGADQQPAVCTLLAERGYGNIEAYRDLAGLPRAVIACK